MTEEHYRRLNALYAELEEDGLEIVVFPCNQFGNQEPEDAFTVAKNVRVNHGVQFQVMEKVDVNGPKTHEVFKFLKAKTNVKTIPWNFGVYFLINKNGDVSAHTGVNPSQLRDTIIAELNKPSDFEL